MTSEAVLDATPSPKRPLAERLKIFAGDIKISHTVFALPFALLSTFLATNYRAADGGGGHVPRLGQLLLILACMVTARTVAMAALAAVLPRAYWVEINKLLVPFGKFVCTGRAPKCSTCPVLEFCRQVGVTTHR